MRRGGQGGGGLLEKGGILLGKTGGNLLTGREWSGGLFRLGQSRPEETFPSLCENAGPGMDRTGLSRRCSGQDWGQCVPRTSRHLPSPRSLRAPCPPTELQLPWSSVPKHCCSSGQVSLSLSLSTMTACLAGNTHSPGLSMLPIVNEMPGLILSLTLEQSLGRELHASHSRTSSTYTTSQDGT